MDIKELLKDISENHWLIEKENNFFVKYNKEWKEADFFHYVFDNNIIESNMADWFEKYSEELKNLTIESNWEEVLLSSIPSFDKNLNLMVLYQVDEDIKKEDINNAIYKIEENWFYSNKFVLCYKKSQLEGLNKDNILNDIANHNQELQELLPKIVESDNYFIPEQFVFDLLTILSFIKVNFNNDSGIEKQIYSNAQEQIQEGSEDGSIKDNLNENIYEILNDSCKDIDLKNVLHQDYVDNNEINIDILKISDFETQLIELWNKLLKDNSKYTVNQVLEINKEEENGK